MSDVVNNSNIDWLQGDMTYIALTFGSDDISYCPEASQYYLIISQEEIDPETAKKIKET